MRLLVLERETKEVENMIWTKEEEAARTIKTMLEPKGKSCLNCHWSNVDEKSDWIVCGSLNELFKSSSLCAYWTDPKDPTLLKHEEDRRKKLLDKIKGTKE